MEGKEEREKGLTHCFLPPPPFAYAPPSALNEYDGLQLRLFRKEVLAQGTQILLQLH